MRISCFQHRRWTLLFLCLSEIVLSVSVSSTTAEEEVLNGAVGDSITFPTRVPVSGAVIYESSNIGLVFNKQTETDLTEKFKNRLHWNSQSGFFTLSDLRTEDSGVYTVQSTKEEKRIQDYQLNVYDKVSAPQLIKLNSSPPESELCLLQCSVRNVSGLNLSWFKGDVLLNHTSSSSLNDTRYLLLEIQQFNNDTYSCVASNPVSKETTTVNITKHCLHDPGGIGTGDGQEERSHIIIACVCSVIFIFAVIAMTMYLRQRRNQQERSSQHTEDSSATEGLHEEVQYSEINHKNHAQGNICKHAPEETRLLTTIYDQIRPLDPGTSFQGGSA